MNHKHTNPVFIPLFTRCVALICLPLLVAAVADADDHEACGSGKETLLTAGDPVAGVIGDVGDTDGFRFTASAGEMITLIIDAFSGDSFLDAVLTVFDETGTELISVDDVDGNPDPRIDGFRIPSDGVYCAEVRSVEGGDDLHTYILTFLSEGPPLEDDHDDLTGTPTPLVADTPVSGFIGAAGDRDAFQFTATAEQIITLDVDADTDGSPLDATLVLYDSGREHLARADEGVEDRDPLLRRFAIPADGTYFAEVRSFFSGDGGEDFTYTLTLTIEEGGGLVYPAYDVNQDGKVDIFDLVLVGQHFGEPLTPATPTALFGQPRAASPEAELRLLMTPSVTDTRQLTISINTTAIADLYGYHFSVQYDPVALELLAALPSQVLAGALPQSYWHVSQQGTQLELTQTRGGTREGVEAAGSLVTLVFNVKRIQPSQSPIRLVDLQLADSLTRSIPANVVGEPVSMADLFPAEPVLLQNYPNPFNPETWIPYQIPADSEVVISIYDAKGERVRQLELGHQHVGTYITRGRAAYWDGTDTYGERVASGVYFYQIRAGAFSATRKMAILK